ncbi:unnamed protein product [Vicia faba]|uniref:Uncharacterized protein n=1 Tax=Vicia faba TaxID=3906 RepID=A0AAV1AF23_VICFA|nr:unnamed protein product [Vicia faba]
MHVAHQWVMCSLARDMVCARVVELGETSRAIEFLPPKERRDALKALAEGAATQVCTQLAEVKALKQSLGKTRDVYKGLEEWTSLLMDEAVATSVYRFEEVKRQFVLLYPHMDLSYMDPF